MSWHPSIGDPSIAGWVTVLLYFATAAICGLASLKAQATSKKHGPSTKTEPRFWAYVCGMMLFLSVNKQIDFQTLLTQIGRYLATSGGWYEHRQSVQLVFILALVSFAIIALSVLLSQLRNAAIQVKAAMAGLCLLATFVVVRAASFHHIDRFIGYSFIGLKWNVAFELFSISSVAAPALFALRGRPGTPHPPHS